MKNKSIITILSLCLGLGMATTSCEDMLNSESDRHSYEVAGDTLYSYWGILKSLQNIGERYVILGECRGDLIDQGEFTSDSVKAILTFGLNDPENIRDGANRYLKVSDYYHVINSCNAYLAQVDTLLEKANGERYMLREYAQVEAIRAWTYMQLVTHYGDVPYYETPMLSTNDMDNFNALDSRNRVTPTNLWEKLESKLIRAFEIERQWGYPQYDNYGYKSTVCHSTKAMFPTSLVLADLYLMGNQYEKAAMYYYEFLDGKYGGILPTSYYVTAFIPKGEDEPVLSITSMDYPWKETGATNRSSESITAIPSSVNGLWGTVQRGVNDLFGFEATIRQSTSTSDSTTTASISLYRNWERQLGPSAGYDNLRLAQNFEIYRASNPTELNAQTQKPIHLEGIGDARGVTGKYGDGFISNFGSGDYYVGIEKTQRYIMKQNPMGSYSTVYPMVYRKSLVWLRYAEALNRAGYPGHAFAILKDGLVWNKDWRPGTEESEFAPKEMRVHYEYKRTELEADGKTPVKDENGEDKVITLILPEDWETNDKCLIAGEDYDYEKFKKDTAAFHQYITEECNANEHFDSIRKNRDDVKYIEHMETHTKGEATSYTNYMSDKSSIVCNYITRDEMLKSNKEWLDFNKNQFSGNTSLTVKYIQHWPLENHTSPTSTGYSMTTGGGMSRGIHQKGCGLLKPGERESDYNFVDQVNRKLMEMGEITEPKSKAEIYSNVTDRKIIQAVEELILDEAALELAFEGNRFPDLMRIALRRQAEDGGSAGDYMAKKIGARGSDAASWANNLKDIKKWYLPLPDYSNRPQ